MMVSIMFPTNRWCLETKKHRRPFGTKVAFLFDERPYPYREPIVKRCFGTHGNYKGASLQVLLPVLVNCHSLHLTLSVGN